MGRVSCEFPEPRDFNVALTMTRLAPSMVFIIGLYAGPAAAQERVTAAEPIAVAVEPKDDVAAPKTAIEAVPAAESKATLQPPKPPASKTNEKDPPRFEGDERGLALEIEPFGWRVPLFGR